MTEFYPYFVSPAVPTEEINHTFWSVILSGC